MKSNTIYPPMSEREISGAAISREAAMQGMVLLKNINGVLPLKGRGKIALFGNGAARTIRGGTGSGDPFNGGLSGGGDQDVDQSLRYHINILNAMETEGFEIVNREQQMAWARCYDLAKREMKDQVMSVFAFPEESLTTEKLEEYAKETETAICVISRNSGEGNDRFMKKEVSIGDKKYEIGDYRLSAVEMDNLKKLRSAFSSLILVLNVPGSISVQDLEAACADAILLMGQAGQEGGAAVTDILTGKATPSGKLTATWAKKYEDYPTAGNFLQDFNKAVYTEGIYVGYKFYETAAEEGLIQYEDTVQYPFGYGLSYTTFDKTIENFKDNGDTVTFDVTVKNTGDVAGKDVIELYYTAPYTNGGIEKAAANLIAFEKTETLDPGAAETKSITINKEDMASYDSEGIKISGGGYILEAGEYTISLRSDSHTVLAEEKFTVDSDIDYSKDGRSSDETVATNQFEDYSRGDFEQLSRANGFANYESACGKLSEDAYVMSDETRKAVEENVFGIYDSTKYNDDSDEMPKMEQDNGLQLADLTGKSYDDEDWDKLLDQMSFEDMSTLINVGGWQTAEIQSVGKIATSDCDGPAGLNNFITKTYGTAYPSEVLIAQTWNKDLAKEVGDSMGQEYVDADNFGWYGPAMNIHRSAFAGRNFEYYSEDGVLSGYMAANEMNGAAVKGVYPYIKHFALNDQETNRCSFLLTFASEQTIREGYLKAFELAVKGFEGNAMAAMSSFNWIGTVPSCANNGLLNNVLRGEWGFVGMVETDYDGSYGYMITDHCIRNGNDLMLGFNSAESNKLTDESATAVLAMRQASKNILYTVANSGYYADGNPAAGMSNMTKLFVTVDVILAVLLIAADAIVIVRFRKKRKNVDNAEA